MGTLTQQYAAMEALGGRGLQSPNGGELLGNLITVKNSFLDVQISELRPPELARASTAPPSFDSCGSSPRREPMMPEPLENQAGWVDRLWGDINPETLREHLAPGSLPQKGRSAPSVMMFHARAPSCSSSSDEEYPILNGIQATSPEIVSTSQASGSTWSLQGGKSAGKAAGQAILAQIGQGPLASGKIGKSSLEGQLAGQAILSQISQASASSHQHCPSDNAIVESHLSGARQQGHSQTWSQTGHSAATRPATDAQKNGSSSAGAAALPQPQTLLQEELTKGVYRLTWTVDARKLKGNDKQAVSPPFEVPFKFKNDSEQLENITFKLMICPCSSADLGSAPRGRLDQSFKRVNGTGIIQLKCEGDVEHLDAQVMFRFWIGRGDEPHSEPRNPDHHDFAKSAICGYKSQDVWDFVKVQDNASMTFNVCAEIAPPFT